MSLLHPRDADPQRAALVVRDRRWTWSEIDRVIEVAVRELRPWGARRVGVLHRGDGPTWSALAAFETLGAEVFLLNAALSGEEVSRLAGEFQFAAVVDSTDGGPGVVWRSPDPLPPPVADATSSVTILTSGTTGRPKAARHTWASLCRPVRIGAGAVWLQTYRPHLYAGLQVAMQCLGSGGTLVNPGAEASPDEVIAAMVRHGVECASATPSYWRRLLIFGDPAALRAVKLRQITLGGELVDQQVLDMLQETFPAARIVHIYATTELGRCFSVTDAQAGFPARFIGQLSPDGVELRVEDGELFVRSANAMQGYDASQAVATPRTEWFPTGDLVRREGDRYFFVGRRSDIINVGGNKVSPQEVEPVLRAVPGVGEVRVYARRSSIAGQLVAAQIVPLAGADPEAVKAAAIQACVNRLLPHQRPRLVDIVDQIELSEAGKVVRR
jgi:acyl-CoA synthetase (AMP-forming)/AMP-acid ligase II